MLLFVFFEEPYFVALSGLVKKYKNISIFLFVEHFPFKNGNKKQQEKVGAVIRVTQEEHPRNSQSPNTYVRIINEEYITQAFEEIEGRVNKKMSQEISKTGSRVLGALFKLDKFLSNTQVQTQSGNVPGTSRNTGVENQKPNGDRSQNDPNLEVGSFFDRSHQSVDAGSEEAVHTKLY